MKELGQLEDEILQLLKRGRDKAITGAVLSKALNEKDDRQIRKAILGLIKRGIPIVSSVGKDPGYFIAENYQEALEYRETLRSRIKGDAVRLKYFKRSVQLNVKPKQGVLNLVN